MFVSVSAPVLEKTSVRALVPEDNNADSSSMLMEQRLLHIGLDCALLTGAPVLLSPGRTRAHQMQTLDAKAATANILSWPPTAAACSRGPVA